jgi:uncharacterized C2H2 Zn-finger protein
MLTRSPSQSLPCGAVRFGYWTKCKRGRQVGIDEWELMVDDHVVRIASEANHSSASHERSREMPDATEAGCCPRCGYVEEEAFDYNVLGDDLYQCGQCGIIFAQDEKGKTTIVEDAGF